MAFDSGLVAWVEEALAPIGRVTWRPMMGGAALYCDGTVFAIVALDDLWFKSDAVADAEWDAAGCDRFTYDAAGTVKVMNYRRAPGDVHDDAEAMRHWAAIAIAAGERAPKRKPRRPAARG
jgi:DNA transformation protein and related proteins